MNPMKKIAVLCCLMIFLCLGCAKNKTYYLSGNTMGTVYHITLISKSDPDSMDLSNKITARLEAINHGMSLFDEKSELSRFNAAPGQEPVCLDQDFMTVFQAGKELYRVTGGAWDGSIGPLVNLWGFGHDAKSDHIPDEADIRMALARTGFNKIDMTEGHCLIKQEDTMALDFGSIAKGFAVDEISALLRANGIRDSLVEIGGEVRASGTKYGVNWTVGINTPSPEASVTQVIKALELHDRSIATSGDYRNFRVEKGKQYTHVIDPATGWPVTNQVASVSVLADSTVYADGLATALMVMGESKGLELVRRLDKVECLFILKMEDGGFRQAASSGWPNNR